MEDPTLSLAIAGPVSGTACLLPDPGAAPVDRPDGWHFGHLSIGLARAGVVRNAGGVAPMGLSLQLFAGVADVALVTEQPAALEASRIAGPLEAGRERFMAGDEKVAELLRLRGQRRESLAAAEKLRAEAAAAREEIARLLTGGASPAKAEERLHKCTTQAEILTGRCATLEQLEAAALAEAKQRLAAALAAELRRVEGELHAEADVAEARFLEAVPVAVAAWLARGVATAIRNQDHRLMELGRLD